MIFTKNFIQEFPAMKRTGREHGFSLVELMVALTLSLFLITGVIQIFISTNVVFHTQEGISQIQESQRIAMDQLIQDVSSGGYMGCLPQNSDRMVNTLTIKDPADIANNGRLYDFENPIFGDEGGAAPDTLYIRRASEGAAVPLTQPMDSETDITLEVDAAHPNYTSLNQWDIVVVSDCSDAAVFLITNDPQDNANLGVIERKANEMVPTDLKYEGQSNANNPATNSEFTTAFGSPQTAIAKIYKVGTARYSVQPSKSGNGNSLYVDSGRAFELIEGVEDFQVLYGIHSGNADDVHPTPSNYVNADEVVDWNNVVSIKLTLTLATLDSVGSDIDADGKIRKTFSATIRMRNRFPS